MSKMPLAALAVAIFMLGGWPSCSQAATGKSVHKLDFDPGGEGGPDPLTPAESKAPAPAAPGAPDAANSSAGAGDADPVVLSVREHLAAMTANGKAAHRDDMAALLAFYAGATSPMWVDKSGFTERGRQAIEEIRRADDWGLKAAAFDLPDAPGDAADDAARADAEVKLSLAVLKYARQARGGRLDPQSVSRLIDQKPAIYEPTSVLRAIAVASAADAYLRDLHPKHVQFQLLRKALLAARNATPGKEHAANIQRLIVNMERWRWMPDELGSLYVWDSVPEQMTSVVHDGKTILSEKIVVGKSSTPTPMFSADMQFIIFHPSWGVPPGIKVNELGPQLRNTGGGWFFSTQPTASSVLRSHGLRVTMNGQPIDPDSVNWAQADIRRFEFEQPPGPTNVLGVVKFRFPNKHNVYMHDTPERNLFGGAVRAFSHGCMRVQNAVRMAEVLLEHDMGLSASEAQERARRGGEIKLPKPIPVHVTYFTAVADEAGNVKYHADLYGLDARIASALEGQPVHLASATVSAAGTEASPPSGPRARRIPARKKQQPAAQEFNPFAAIFGN